MPSILIVRRCFPLILIERLRLEYRLRTMPVTIRHMAAMLFALTVLLVLPHAGGQKTAAATGSVCTGVFAAFTPTKENRRVYMTVGDSEKIYFKHRETVVLNNLDLHKTYIVHIFDGDKQTDAWKLRFDRLKVHMVTIWRSPGYWHMDPNPLGKCG